MGARQLLNEEIVDILFKHLFEEQLSVMDQSILNKWLNLSSYNRSVFNDLVCQQKLRNELMEVYTIDRSQFWNVVISYRTALHTGIPAPKGNFWKRCKSRIQKILMLRR